MSISRFYWKGKKVSEATYNHRVTLSVSGSKIAEKRILKRERDDAEKQQVIEKKIKKKKYELNNESFEKPGEGRRIVELLLLGELMWCVSCKECLSFQYIESELRRGLGSIFKIRCHKCLLVNEITTGTRHGEKNQEDLLTRFDVNSKMALGKYFCNLSDN